MCSNVGEKDFRYSTELIRLQFREGSTSNEFSRIVCGGVQEGSSGDFRERSGDRSSLSMSQLSIL